MNEQLHRALFGPVAPPPGGLTRLQAKLDAAQARRRRVAVAVPVLALAALALVMLRPARTTLTVDHPSLAAMNGSVSDRPVVASGGTAVTVVSQTDAVVLALVARAP